MKEVPGSLWTTDKPAAVTVHNENGSSPLLIVVDHAGNSTPHALGRLGVTESEYLSHIAWDIGGAEVSRVLAEALDATLA
jgi:predicted N-formylglutamate amidohydrolase